MDHLFLLLSVLAITSIGAAFMSARIGNERRDVYLMAGFGVGIGVLCVAGMLGLF